jgi:diguanylate cyclase (GGDEF)-like protein
MTPNIKEKLQALFADYAKNLPNKIKKIREEWNSLLHKWDEQAFKDFHRDVHSLCGSSGTYGYTAIGKVARDLEIYLKPFLVNPLISTEQYVEIARLLDLLESMLKNAVPEQVAFSNSPIKKIVSDDVIYILDNNEKFVTDLQINFDEAGYKLYQIKDVHQLKNLFLKIQPAAVIIDIEIISDTEANFLAGLCSQDSTSIPIFCTAQSGEITNRLKAIRVGSTAFFQKPIEPILLTQKLEQLHQLSDEPYRILIIDDSLTLAKYYALILKEAGMITHYITNPLMLIEAIENFQPDLLLMDIYMPKCTGLELALVLRQEPQYTQIPIIFLSSEDDRFKQLSALNIGGDDFLVKPIEPQHLIKVIMLRAKRATILSSFMTKDSLTGLLNHTNILQRLDIEIARAQRSNETLSFIMLDLDHFKLINDNYGHPIGDKVIRKISSLLMSSFRKTDFIGRYGGEEFAIILPNTNQDNALVVCEKLRIKFSELKFNVGEHEFNATISAGIASYPNLKDPNSLLTAADQALYVAKHNGRNQVVEFSKMK